MRSTLQTVFLLAYCSICTALMTGCVNTLTGDLGDLFSDSGSEIGNLEKQSSPEYKLDPLALRNDLPPTGKDESAYKEVAPEEELADYDESTVFELLPKASEPINPLTPQIANQPLGPTETTTAHQEESRSIGAENDFNPIRSGGPTATPKKQDNTTDFLAASSAATESNSTLQPVVKIAENPLAPNSTIDVVPFKTEHQNNSESFSPLPPTQAPPKLFVSEAMQQLPPPFANHPEVEPCEYPECEIGDNEIHLQSKPETNPVTTGAFAAERFVIDIVDNSMDPDRVNETTPVSTRIDTNPSTLFNKKAEPVKTMSELAESSTPLTWDEQLQQTVSAIESEIQQSTGQQRASLESAKIVLESLHSNLANANESVPSAVKQYWIHQINALKEIISSSIDDQNVNAITTRTLRELRMAATALRESANLQLNSAVFCSKVIGFGQYDTYETNTFRPNQPVLVYCEIENFTPRIEQQDGNEIYLTRISSSYRIIDENGKTVQSTEYPMVSDKARKLRNDFFMHLPIRFGDLRIGQYQLEVEVHDYGNGKKAKLASPLRFSIR